jgi:hypothetical protein
MSRAVPITAGLILLAAGLWLWESRSRRAPDPAPAPEPQPPRALAPPIPQGPTRPVPPPHGRNLWDGVGPGSWVLIESKTTTGDKVDTVREKYTLMAMEGPLASLTREPKAPNDPFLRDSAAGIESQDKWSESEPKEEKLTIDGKEFTCQVRDYAGAGENKFGKFTNRARVWRSPGLKLPYREIQRNGPEIALHPDLLRLELELKNLDRGSRQFLDLRVTDLDETLDIGGRKVACIVEEGTWEERRKGTSALTLKRWISDDVPGRIVRTESEGTSNDKPTRKTLNVVDFEVKPK